MALSSTTFGKPTPAADAGAVELVPIDDRGGDRRIRQWREHHGTILALSLLIVSASFLLRLQNSERVAVKWLNIDLPPMCGSRALFGIECPGCGLTRSFVALAGGDFQQSLAFHRVGWLLAAAVLAQIPYRLFALRELRSRVAKRVWPLWFGYLIVATLVVNWLVNMWNR